MFVFGERKHKCIAPASSYGANSNARRPTRFADKIVDPHLPVCPGGATRLEVCLLMGVLTSQYNLSEVRIYSLHDFVSATPYICMVVSLCR